MKQTLFSVVLAGMLVGNPAWADESAMPDIFPYRTHVETLGIFPFEEVDAETPPDDDDDDGEDSETREIRSLPNPKIEESVWEHTSDEEDPSPLKPYSDMYVYV